MLSCKKCGATMSGVDLVCKKCGTPWGKSGKSKAPIFFSILLVIGISLTVLYVTNRELFYQIIPLEKPITSENNDIPNETENNIIKTPENLEQSANIPETTPQPEVTPEPETVPEPEIILPPVFTNVTASSSLKSQGNFSYTPDKMTDNDTTTAWLEAAKDNGINEWVQFSADTEQTVSGITIFNGYQKNSTTYQNNGRLKKINVVFSDGNYLTYDLSNQTYKESLNGIDIKFENPIKTTSLRISILDVYKGIHYTDTGITQINIY